MIDSDQRCSHCPVELGLECEGLRVRRLCELADPEAADTAAGYRELLQRLARPASSEPEVPESRPSRELPQTIRLLRRMSECPDREPRADCGCAGLAQCRRGLGLRGLVNHQDCFKCLDAECNPQVVPDAEGRPARASLE